MARIQFTRSVVLTTFNNGTNSFSKTSGLGGSTWPASTNRLTIFKGPIPTTAELRALNAGWVLRAADVLVDFSAYNLVDVIEGFKIKLKSTVYTPATGSGVATWFAFVGGTSGSYRSSAIAIGTVSDMSGNGELKISDVNIVAGNSYITKPMEINLPYKFDF